MMLLKSCPRCGGDRMLEEVLGEAELVCLQCGHRSSLPWQKPWAQHQPRQTPTDQERPPSRTANGRLAA